MILTKHLTNVLALIRDRKQKSQQSAQHQAPEVVNLTDYYPFGMVMPGRSYAADVYRYGFQGQEEDDELWGGEVSCKYRVEDPRLGRFFSVDPLAPKYPHNSPYAFSENRLIDAVELEGLERAAIQVRVSEQNYGDAYLKYVDYAVIEKGSRVNFKPDTYFKDINVRGVNYNRDAVAEKEILKAEPGDLAPNAVLRAIRRQNQTKGGGRVNIGRMVYLDFETSKGSSPAEVQDHLDKKEDEFRSFFDALVKMVVDDPQNQTLEVKGQASEAGENNTELAEARAMATREYLIQYALDVYGVDISDNIKTSIEGGDGVSKSGATDNDQRDRGVYISTIGF